MVFVNFMRQDKYDANKDNVIDDIASPNRARGAYDAIVYIQDGDVIAEDATGAEISSGTAGTDDATVIQASLDSFTYGVAYVVGDMTIKSQITLAEKKGIIGTSSIEPIPDTQAPHWLIDTPVGIYVGAGRLGDWQTVRNGYTIKNISFRSNTNLSNVAIQIDSAQNTMLDNLFFKYFDKAIQGYRIWTSDWGFFHSHKCNYGVYLEDSTLADQSADLDIKYFGFCYSYLYNFYSGIYGIKNMHIAGGIAESIGSDYGGGFYLGANTHHCKICPTFAAAPLGKYLIYDAGQYNTFDFQSGSSGEILLGYGATLKGNFSGQLGVVTGNTNIEIVDARFKDITDHEKVIDIQHAYTTLSKVLVSTSDSKYQVLVSAGGKAIIGDSQFLMNNSSSRYLLADSFSVFFGSGATNNNIHDCVIDNEPTQSNPIWGDPTTTWFNYNLVNNITGFKNKNSNITLKQVSVDVAGVTDVAIAHGLATYPQIQHCAITIVKDTDVYDYVAYPVLVSAGITNLNIKWVVVTPSATPGAKAKLAVTIT